MIKGKLENGFKFEIDPNNLDDYELVEMLADLEEKPLLTPKVVAKILGEEQKNKLLDHLRDEKGKVSMKAMESSVAEILLSSQEVKN